MPCEGETDHFSVIEITEEEFPSQDICQNIINYAEIGYLTKLTEILAELKISKGASANFVAQFERDIQAVRFDQIIALLKVKAKGSKHVL